MIKNKFVVYVKEGKATKIYKTKANVSSWSTDPVEAPDNFYFKGTNKKREFYMFLLEEDKDIFETLDKLNIKYNKKVKDELFEYFIRKGTMVIISHYEDIVTDYNPVSDKRPLGCTPCYEYDISEVHPL